MELGKLTAVDPRTVWPHEAHDFTPWLLAHADALADVLGIDLELTANEHPVGGFALDLIGKDVTNGCALIVENQLTVTDHAHLGQLLTYAAGTDAATVVWIAVSFREEHRQAVDWLNSLAGEDARFFGIEIGAVRIGGSPVAPVFTLRAQPNDWHARLSAIAKSGLPVSAKGQLYREFWGRFLQRVHAERPAWTRAKIPTAENWMVMPSPVKGGVNGFNFLRPSCASSSTSTRETARRTRGSSTRCTRTGPRSRRALAGRCNGKSCRTAEPLESLSTRRGT